MYKIGKQFKFDAAHRLDGLPEGHKCGNLHGHTYTVEIVVASNDLADEGWVFDFTDMKPIKTYIDAELDHKYLNDVLNFQPTSELLARHFYTLAYALLNLPSGVSVYKVRVSETQATWAEYSR